MRAFYTGQSMFCLMQTPTQTVKENEDSGKPLSICYANIHENPSCESLWHFANRSKGVQTDPFRLLSKVPYALKGFLYIGQLPLDEWWEQENFSHHYECCFG